MNRCQQSLIGASALCAVLAAAGCVVAPAQPITELALARTAITQAEQAGAAHAAPVELSAARERLAEAEHLAGDDPDRARWRNLMRGLAKPPRRMRRRASRPTNSIGV